MASRMQQKERARAARLAAEQAAAAKTAKTRRLRMLAGVVAIAVIVVVAVIAVSVGNGGGGNTGLAKGKTGQKVYAQVHALLGGIPQHGTTLGDPRAKYTLTFFGDLQCPICASFATGQNGGGLPQFIQDQVRTGHAKVMYRSLCTATCNDFSQTLFDQQQTAAYAAGEQNKFYDYEELFYRQQGTEGSPYVTPTFLKKLAQQIPGLNFNTWMKYRGDPTLLGQVQNDAQLAIKQLPPVNGGRGTPGLSISGPKGTHFIAEGLVGYSQLQAGMKAVS